MIWPLSRRAEFFGSLLTEMNWDLKHHEICRTLGVGVSIVWLRKTFKNSVSLSPRVDELKSEVNKTVRTWDNSPPVLYVCICICMVYNSLLIVFHWSLSDGKPPQISRTLLSIRSDRSNAVVWTIPTYVLISNYFSLFTNHLTIVPSTLITTDISHFHVPYFLFSCKV